MERKYNGVLSSLGRVPQLANLLEHLRTPLYRNGYALLISTTITSGLGVIFWWLAARTYTTEVLGANSAAIAAMTLLAGVSQLNLQGTLIRYVPLLGRKTTRFVTLSYASTLVLAAILGLIFTLGLQVWAPQLEFITATPFAVLWFIISIMVSSIFTVQDSTLAGLRQALWIPVENAVFAVTKIVFLVLLAAPMADSGIFAAWTVSMLLVVIPVNYLIFAKLLPKHSIETADRTVDISRREIGSYIGSNYINALLGYMSTHLLPLIIVNVAGVTANAYFYPAWLIASSLQLIASNMTTSLTIEGARDQAQLNRYVRNMLLSMMRLTVPLVVLIVIGSQLILGLFGEAYAEAGTTLLRLMALAAIPNLINYAYLSVARVRNWTGGIILVQAGISIPILVLGYILLKLMGITGIGWALLISETTVAMILLLTSMRPILFSRAHDTTAA